MLKALIIYMTGAVFTNVLILMLFNYVELRAPGYVEQLKDKRGMKEITNERIAAVCATFWPALYSTIIYDFIKKRLA